MSSKERNPIPYGQVYRRLLSQLTEKWVATHYVESPRGGVYLVPINWGESTRKVTNGTIDWTIYREPRSFNSTQVQDHRLRGHRLLFEFFHLENSLEVKISARALITDGLRTSLVEPGTLFGNLELIAGDCPRPRDVRGMRTRTCAVWPRQRPVFGRHDYDNMAHWIIGFLAEPPTDFNNFVTAAESVLQKNI